MNSQGKRINRQENERRVLFTLRKLLRTQKAAARAVGCSDDMFRYYTTDAKKIPTEIVVRAKAILRQNREPLFELGEIDVSIHDALFTLLPFPTQVKLAKGELLEAFKTDEALNALEPHTKASLMNCIEAVLQKFFTHQEKTYRAQ